MMQFSENQLARLWLQCAPMGAWNKLSELKEKWGGAWALWQHFSPQYAPLLGEGVFSQLCALRDEKCASILRRMEELGAGAVFPNDKEYPPLLSQIASPPDMLFCQGMLPKADTPAIAIVGSRSATRYGVSQARKIARELAAKGVVIVSGLARGIDAAAHQGALDAGGKTVAVLGSGVGDIYPPENKELAAKIIATGGAVISELPPDAPPMPYHFPVRNRIIAGMSDCVLLIEARYKSGTHSTINHALNLGREVFALPGNVDAPGSELPLMLLKDGAHICTCASDILETMDWEEKPPVQASFLEEPESPDPILKALSREEKTLEELIAETGLSAGELSTKLTLLEISGKIERRAGRAYALRR